MSLLRQRARCVWVVLAVSLPLALYRVLAERASWPPHILYSTRLLYQSRAHDSSTEGCVVTGITFSPDGHTLAVRQMCMQASDIVLLDVDSTATHTLHQSSVGAIAFAPDGYTLAAAGGQSGQDGSVRLWDTKARRLERILPGTPSLWSVACSPDRVTLATGSFHGVVQVWDYVTGRLLRTLRACRIGGDFAQPHSGPPATVCFSPDGKTLATGGDWDGSVKLWNVQTGHLEQTLRGHSRGVSALAFAPDGTRLASGSGDETVRVWNLHSSARPVALNNLGAFVQDVAFSADGKLLATGGSQVRVWAMPSGHLLRTLAANGQLAFGPDGKMLATTNTKRSSSNGQAQSGIESTVTLWRIQ